MADETGAEPRAEPRAEAADPAAATPGRRAGGGDAADARSAFPDWRFAPNIGGHPDIYEIENHALDPGGHVIAAMRSLAPWDGRTLVDLGCGTGFWLPGYARDADSVIGVEPDPALRTAAARRIHGLPGVQVVPGSAEHLPLADSSPRSSPPPPRHHRRDTWLARNPAAIGLTYGYVLFCVVA